MGNSRPPQAAEISLVDSYAHRVEAHARLVLADPRVEVPEDATVLLRHRKSRVTLEATWELVVAEHGRQLLIQVPLDPLRDGTWAVRLRAPDGEQNLGCRLLVQGDRPLVLLWGAKAVPSALPRPHPRNPAPTSPTARARLATVRLVRKVSRRARRSA